MLLADFGLAHANERAEPALLGTAKLMGAMGLTDQAVRIANALAGGATRPREALLTAGDALALAGRYPEAL